jgi:hypothetical protein
MKLSVKSSCQIFDNRVVVNDKLLFYQESIVKFADFAKTFYKQQQIAYPKFHKMDALGKLGFLAAEMVLQDNSLTGYPPEKVGIVLSNSSASLETDLIHQESIHDRSRYFPSPSVFVYTLPNIVIGEICIRHGIKGENAFFITEKPDFNVIFQFVYELFSEKRVQACLCGWTEVQKNNFTAVMLLVVNEVSTGSQDTLPGANNPEFNNENFTRLFKHK